MSNVPKITIDIDRCKGCSLCIEACPRKCISLSKKFNRIGYTPAEFAGEKDCTGCGFCFLVCPDVCIEVHK